MYQRNLLSMLGGITLAGTPTDLTKIKTPTFLLSTREDHIAPWKSTYAATHLYSGPVKFVLSASGHMAGVTSAPGGKYGHWTNEALPPTAEEWFAGAQPHTMDLGGQNGTNGPVNSTLGVFPLEPLAPESFPFS